LYRFVFLGNKVIPRIFLSYHIHVYILIQPLAGLLEVWTGCCRFYIKIWVVSDGYIYWCA